MHRHADKQTKNKQKSMVQMLAHDWIKHELHYCSTEFIFYSLLDHITSLVRQWQSSYKQIKECC